MKLVSKLVAAFLLVALIPLAVLGYLSYDSAKTALQKQALEDLTLVAEAKEGHLYSFLEAVKGRALDFSSDGFIRDSVEAMERLDPKSPEYAELQKALNEHLKRNKAPLDKSIHMIAVIDLSGRIIAATKEQDIGSGESGDDYFIQGRKGVYVSDVHTSHHFLSSEQLHIAVSAPLTDKETGALLGVIVNFYDTHELEKMLSGEFQVEKGAVSGARGRRETLDIYLVNREKFLITPSRFSSEVMKQKVETLPVLKCAEGREITGVYENYLGTEVIGASMCIPSKGWTLVAEISTAEAFAPVAALMERITWLGFAVALLTFFLAYLMSIGISNSVITLSRVTRKLASGDFSARAPVESQDEIGELAFTFNEMARQLDESHSALRASEERFRSVVNSASDGIVSADNHGAIMSWNRGAQKIFGYAEEEVLGKPVEVLMPERYREAHRKALERMHSTGELRLAGKILEVHGLRKDGSEFPVELSLSTWKAGGELFCTAILRDITERKRAEEELRKSEERFRLLTESTLTGVYLIQDNLFRYINPALASVFGYRAEEVIDKLGPLDLTAPESRELVAENIRRRVQGEVGDIRYSFKGLRKDGTLIEVEVHGARIDYKGKPAIIGTLLDITERKRAEELLRRSAEELAAIHEIDRNIIANPELHSLLQFIVGKAKELTKSDAAFYSFVEGDVIRHHAFAGIQSEEFRRIELKKGSGLGWLAVEEKKPVAVEDFFTDERLKGAPYEAVKKEGLISVLAIPCFSGKGDVIGLLYVANRRKMKFSAEQVETLATLATQTSVAVEHAKLFEDLKRAYEELKSLDQLKSDILSNVSHELRTPLTIAKGMVELAMMEKDEEERNRLLAVGRRALLKQNEIIENLITLSAVHRKELKLSVENIELDYVLTLVQKIIQPRAAEKGIEIEIAVEEGLAVKGDYNALKNVLLNLLDNAIKFNKEKGRVTIEARRKDSTVEICVADTGIGIAKEHLPKLFTPLYQIDPSARRRYSGVGAGLAVVKQLVEAMGGSVSVESEPGKGSRFCVALPGTREQA